MIGLLAISLCWQFASVLSGETSRRARYILNGRGSIPKKIKEMITIDKEKIVLYSIIAVLAIALAYCLFSVHDNAGRVDAIKQQLDTVSRDQQSAIDRLSKIETGLADSIRTTDAAKTAVDDAAGRIEQSQGRVNTSADLISDSQRIINAVRERN